MKNNSKKNKFIIFIILILIMIFLVIYGVKSYSNDKNIKTNEDQGIGQNEIEEKEIDNNIVENNEISDEEVKNTNETVDNINNDLSENITNNEKNTTENIEFGSNVAFIGDSRTQAFLAYTGLTEVVDYTNIGLMVDTAITKKIVTNKNGEKITILEDLKNNNVNTIYIMLGINELGWVYNSIFIQKYEELIDKIKEVKPECEIILQSIIPVTKTKSDNDKIYNNNKIKEYNKLIKELANKKKIKFIDLVPIITDEKGNLPENASSDGIHLNKEYCLKWLECLKNN